MARLLGLLLLTSLASADDPLPKSAETFEVNGHKAFLYAPPKSVQGKPWVWYAPTLKGVSLVQRKAYFEGFLKAGIGIAGVDLGEVRGSPASTAEFTRFYDEMVRRGWSAKPILLGQSRGGLMMLAWAVRHPDKVKAFAGIYPVCNLGDWPLKHAAAAVADYGLSEADIRARLAEFNPVDHLTGLLKRKVPMFVVHGDADVVVPYETNTRLLKERYEAGGGPIEVKLIPGEGHQVSPAFFECRELVAFVLKQANGSDREAIDAPGNGPTPKTGKAFLDQKKEVPPRKEWTREITSRTGGPITFHVKSQGPFAVTVVTDKAYKALQANQRIDKKDVLLTVNSKETSFEKSVTVAAGSTWLIIENQTDKRVEFHLECFEP